MDTIFTEVIYMTLQYKYKIISTTKDKTIILNDIIQNSMLTYLPMDNKGFRVLWLIKLFIHKINHEKYCPHNK